MAATYTATAAVFGATARPGHIRSWMTAFADWRARQATRKALSKLSDHELEDIGLSRGDIDAMSF